MKFLVLFACVAAASAQHLVAYPNGAVAPAKTPSVAAAEAAHFAAKGALPLNALGYNGYGYAGYGYGAYPYAAHGAYPYAYGAAAPLAYNGLYHAGAYAGYAPYAAHFGGLVAHPNGAVVPVDEPAVQAAKAEHFAAKGVAPIAVAAPLGYAANFAYHGLVAHPNGALVPAEPADVVSARAAHLAHF